MNQIPQPESSYGQLLQTLDQEKCLFSCKEIHKHSCITNALKNTLYTAFQFNKILSIYFVFTMIKSLKRH